MHTTQQSLEYKSFFQHLEKEEITRLQALIKNTDLSETSWEDDHLDRSHKKIINYMFELAENRLNSYSRHYNQTDELFTFLEPDNCKSYDSCYVEDQVYRANNLTISKEMNFFNKNQDKANVACYHTLDHYYRLLVDIRVYQDNTQTTFTDEFIHFAYLIDQTENDNYPILDDEDYTEIEEIDRIFYFNDYMLEQFREDILEHITNMYPEKLSEVKEHLEQPHDENYFYFLLRDAVEHNQRNSDGYNCEFYEDLEGCYPQAFLVSAQWYLHEFFGCDKYPVLPFYSEQRCVTCDNLTNQ